MEGRGGDLRFYPFAEEGRGGVGFVGAVDGELYAGAVAGAGELCGGFCGLGDCWRGGPGWAGDVVVETGEVVG